jgi:hypothetical protein
MPLGSGRTCTAEPHDGDALNGRASRMTVCIVARYEGTDIDPSLTRPHCAEERLAVDTESRAATIELARGRQFRRYCGFSLATWLWAEASMEASVRGLR